MRKVNPLFFSFLIILCICSCSDYDWNKPDTKANRDGLEIHLGVVPDKNITGVYFFADEWGSDASCWFAFSAPQDVINKIIVKMNLASVKDRSDVFNPSVKEVFHWWNLEERKKSQYYEFRDEDKKMDCYLWYNPETQKCQTAIIYL